MLTFYSFSIHHYLSLSSELTSILQEASTGNMVIFGAPPASSLSIVSSPSSFRRHSSCSSENMDSKSGEVVEVAVSEGCLSSVDSLEVGSGVVGKLAGSVAVGCGVTCKLAGSVAVGSGVVGKLAGSVAVGCGVTCKPTAWIRSASVNSHASIAPDISIRSFISKEPSDAESTIWIVFSSFLFSKHPICLVDNPVPSKAESSMTSHSISGAMCSGIADKSKASLESPACNASSTSVRSVGPSLFAAHSMALIPPKSLNPKKVSLSEMASRSWLLRHNADCNSTKTESRAMSFVVIVKMTSTGTPLVFSLMQFTVASLN